MTADLCIQALQMACVHRNPPRGVIFHSDQGKQYASFSFQKQLSKKGFKPSMCRKGNCYDNAVAESFIGKLKTEEVYDHSYHNRKEARTAIFDYIETFYNRFRRHSTLGNLSPDEFEYQGVA